MNEISRIHRARPTTQVADGVPRCAGPSPSSSGCELGFFTEDDRIELIGSWFPWRPKAIATSGCAERFISGFGEPVA